MRKLMRNVAALPLFLVLFDQARSQLSLPEMPGPPYPDRWGNNRWGVKYDPRIHGRGRSQQSAPSTSSGHWAGGRERDVPEELPHTRFRSNGGPPAYPSRNKWIPGLKPLVSNFLKYRRRPRRPGPLSNYDATELVYRNPYSRRAIDGYVQNYMNRYNSVVSQPGPYSSDSDTVRLQNYIRPSYATSQFQPNEFDRVGNTPTSHMSIVMMKRSDESVDDTQRADINKGSLKDSYLSLASSSTTNTPTYRTLEPMSTLQQPQISKKSSSEPVSRNFANKLRKFYNDYQPGAENTGSAVASSVSSSNSSKSDSVGSSSTFSDDSATSTSSISDDIGSYGTPFEELTASSSRRPSRLRSRPRTPSTGKRGPHYVEKQYISSGTRRRPQGSPSPYRGPPRGPPTPYRGPPGRYSSGPPSSHDFHGDEYSTSPGGFSSGPPLPFDTPEYLDSPPSVYSSGSSGTYSGFPSSSRPMTVSTYTMSGSPPPEFSVDSYDSGLGPYSSPLYTSSAGAPHTFSSPGTHTTITSAMNPFVALPPVPFVPNFSSPPYLSPALVLSPDYHNSPEKERNRHTRKPIKRKKKRFQHTPMNLIRGLLGGRDNQRKDNLREQPKVGDESYKSSNAVNVPSYSLPPGPPPPQYSYNPLVNSLPSGPGGPPPPPPLYNGYSHPPYPVGPPPPPPPLSPLAAGLSNLRDTLTGAPPPSAYYRPPPPPPPRPHNGDQKKDNTQDWPRIFTAMGSSADAVAGGIHAVRKEISKVTGQTLAKGIMMGGSAVHEVSKGMANMIAKMSSV